VAGQKEAGVRDQPGLLREKREDFRVGLRNVESQMAVERRLEKVCQLAQEEG
jgi:hypothetical protein